MCCTVKFVAVCYSVGVAMAAWYASISGSAGVLRCVTVCCSVLQCATARYRFWCGTVCCIVLQRFAVCFNVSVAICRMECEHLWTVTSPGCCSVLQSVAVCCRVIQCAAVRCRLLWGPVCCSVLQCERCNGRMTCEHLWTVASAGVLQYIAVCCSTLLCVAVCHSCGVLQCAAVCCSVLQCVAMAQIICI